MVERNFLQTVSFHFTKTFQKQPKTFLSDPNEMYTETKNELSSMQMIKSSKKLTWKSSAQP